MSHIREVAREAVLKAIDVGLGTASERTAALPDAATPIGREAMGPLTMFERQIFLYEVATLIDQFKRIGTRPRYENPDVVQLMENLEVSVLTAKAARLERLVVHLTAEIERLERTDDSLVKDVREARAVGLMLDGYRVFIQFDERSEADAFLGEIEKRRG